MRKFEHKLLMMILKHPGICGGSVAFFFTAGWWGWCFISSALLSDYAIGRSIFPNNSVTLDISNGSIEHLFEKIALHPVTLVVFYAPWCGESMKMVPEFVSAAKAMKDESLVSFISINCWIGSCKTKFPSNYFPRIFLYHTKYKPIEYYGYKDAARMMQFLDDVIRPFSYVGNTKDLNTNLNNVDNVLVCFLKGEKIDDEVYDVFLAMSIYLTNRLNKPRVVVVLDTNLASNLNLTKHGQLLLSGVLAGRRHYPSTSNYTSSNIIKWIFDHYQEIVTHLSLNPTNMNHYMQQFKKGPVIILSLSLFNKPTSDSELIFKEYGSAAIAYQNCSCSNNASLQSLYPEPALTCNNSFYKPDLCMNIQPLGFQETVCELCQTCFSKCSCVDMINRDVHHHYIDDFIYSNFMDTNNVCSSFPFLTYYYAEGFSVCCKPSEIRKREERETKVEQLQSVVKNLLVKDSVEDSVISLKKSSSAKKHLNMKLHDTFKQILNSLEKLVKVSQEINEEQKPLDGDLKVSIDRMLSPLEDSDKTKYESLLEHTKILDFRIKSESKKNNNNSILLESRSRLETSINISCGRTDLPCCKQHISVSELQGPLGLSHYSGLACATNKSLQFYYMDSDVHKHLLNQMGVDESRPSLMVVDMAQEEHYIFNQNLLLEFTSIVNFIMDYTAGALKRHLNSMSNSHQCDDNPSDGICISEVTTDSFDAMVMRPDKDVLLMFYSPWCGFCKYAYQVFLKLAAHYKDHPSLTFARVDAEANDLPWEYVSDGFPSFILFPKRRKSHSLRYGGDLEITMDNLIAFLEEHVNY